MTLPQLFFFYGLLADQAETEISRWLSPSFPAKNPPELPAKSGP